MAQSRPSSHAGQCLHVGEEPTLSWWGHTRPTGPAARAACPTVSAPQPSATVALATAARAAAMNKRPVPMVDWRDPSATCPVLPQQPTCREMTRCANWRPEQVQQFTWTKLRYSITSSAIARSLSGTLRLSALAVLRLIINSNLVGCWTGRSLVFSPLSIRPA